MKTSTNLSCEKAKSTVLTCYLKNECTYKDHIIYVSAWAYWSLDPEKELNCKDQDAVLRYHFMCCVIKVNLPITYLAQLDLDLKTKILNLRESGKIMSIEKASREKNGCLFTTSILMKTFNNSVAMLHFPNSVELTKGLIIQHFLGQRFK